MSLSNLDILFGDHRIKRDVLEKKWKTFMATLRCARLAQENEEALDEYLNYFICALSDIDITADRQTSANFGTAGILARKLMEDVSSINKEELLRFYIYTGRGYRFFRVLEVIGVGAISCNFELTTLLFSLLTFMRSQPFVEFLIKKDEMAMCKPGCSLEKLDALHNLIKMREANFELPNALESIFNLLKQMCDGDVHDCSRMPFSTNLAETVLAKATEQLKSLLDDNIDSETSRPSSFITQKMIALVVNIGKSLLKYEEPLKKFPRISESLIKFIDIRLRKIEETQSDDPLMLDEIMCCTVGIIDILLSASNNRFNYSQFMKLFHLFFENSVGVVLIESILLLSKSNSSHREELEKLVGALGQLGQNARNLQYGPWNGNDQNLSMRWRRDISSHHDSQLGSEQPCVVGTVTRLLASLINCSQKDNVAGEVLKALTKSGMCCCITLEKITKELLTNFTLLPAKLQMERLGVLKTFVISMSGFQVLSARTMIECESCKKRKVANDKLLIETLHKEYMKMAMSKSIECLQQNEQFVNGYWNIFDLYNGILQPSTPNFTILLLEPHLLSLISGLNVLSIKLELFFRVILPNLLRYSDDGNDGDNILKIMLNVTLLLADIPEVNRILHVFEIMKRLYCKFATTNLRDPILKLLNIMSTVCWATNLNEVSAGNEDDDAFCYVNVEEMNEILGDYHDNLLHYSWEYWNTIKSRLNASEKSEEKTESDESLLKCIKDMWKSMCFITDRCFERREWFFTRASMHKVNEFTTELAKYKWSAVKVTSNSEIEWELLSILIHIIATCQNYELAASSVVKIEEEMENIFMFSSQSDVNYLFLVNNLFSMLTMASLESPIESFKQIQHHDIAKQQELSRIDNLEAEDKIDSLDSVMPKQFEQNCEAGTEESNLCQTKSEFVAHGINKSEHWMLIATKISCPPVLKLLLKLIVKYKLWICDKGYQTQSRYWLPIVDVLKTIIWFGQTCPENCQILREDCHIPSFIFKDFYDVLLLPSTEAFLQLQVVILELFTTSVRDSVMDWELKSYLKLFMKNPSLSNQLLKYLNSILSTVKAEPSHLLTFLSMESTLLSSATPGSTGRTFSGGEQDFSDGETTVVSDSDVRNLLKTVKQHRANDKIYSSLAVASVGMSFPPPHHDLPFGSDGLGVSLWFMVSADHHSNMRKQPRIIHLFTCHYEKLAFEVWLYLDSKLLMFRLTSWDSNSHEVLDAKISTDPLDLSNWQHLFITWIPYMKEKKLAFLIAYNANGNIINSNRYSLESDRRPSRAKLIHWGLLIGHSSSQEKPKPIWHLGHLRLFRGPFTNCNQSANLLYKLGPGNSQLQILEIGLVDPIFKPPRMDEPDDVLVTLRSKLLATYLPQNPSVIIWHSNGETRNKFVEDNLIKTIRIGSYKSSSNYCLSVALTRVGGAIVFISLFGLVIVNFPKEEVIQTNCLEVIFNLIKRDEKMMRHFVDCAGWDLILWAMSTSVCKTNCKMMSVLLQECTSEKVLYFNATGQKWMISKTLNATITNPYLLSLLLSNWKMWNDHSKAILKWLLRSCQHLVDLRHFQRDHNLKILMEIKVLDIIFEILRERWLGGDSTILSKGSSRSIVFLMESLVGSRPALDTLTKFVDCLLAIHPFQNTFVADTRASLYFMPINTLSKLSSNKSSRFSSKNDQPKANEQSAKFSKELETFANLSECTGADKIVSSFTSEQNDLVTSPKEASKFKALEADSISSQTCIEPNLSDSDSEEILPTAPGSLDDNGMSNFDLFSSGSSSSATLSGNEETVSTVMSTLPSNNDGQQIAMDKDNLLNFIDIGIISTGMIALLGNVIAAADNVTFPEVAKIIDCKILVALALHPVASVRTAVVKTFNCYFSKISEMRTMDLYKKDIIFIALSNQLFQYETSISLCETCIELITGEITTLETRNRILPINLRINEPNGIILALTLLPRLCHNAELCESFIYHLSQICQSRDIHFLMFEFGLVQSICLTISSVIISKYGDSDVKEEMWATDHLLNELNDFLTDAIYRFLWFVQGKKFSRYGEAIAIITHYENLELQRKGHASASYLALRNCHAACLVVGLVTVLDHFNWNDYTTDFCCNTPFISKVISRSYPLPSKLPPDEYLQNCMGEIICFTVGHLTNSGYEFMYDSMSTMEQWLCRFTVHILMDGITAIFEFENTLRPLALALGPCWHCHFFKFMSFVFQPQQSLEFVNSAIEHIINTPSSIEAFKLFTRDDEQFSKQLSDYIMNVSDSLSGKELTTFKNVCLGILDPTHSNIDHFKISKFGGKWICSSPKVRRMVKRLEHRYDEVVEIAIEATALVNGKLDEQRKLYLNSLKKKFSDRLYIRQKWLSLVDRLTHERTIWHDSKSFPVSWELDQTEGPQRVRKRLSRCSLAMSERFLLSHAKEKLKMSGNVHPFEWLIKDEDMSYGYSIMINDIQTKEIIQFSSKCSIITPASETAGEVLIGSNCMYFIGDEIKYNIGACQNTTKTEVICHRWKYRGIKEIHKRRYQLQDYAMELFLTNGQTYLLALDSTENRNFVYERVMASELPNLLPEIESIDVHTRMWREGVITNYEYLTQLNKFGGRSFNDLMQYPVFPFTLTDYLSNVLDLYNPDSFRNFSKPIAIQAKERESHYINQYAYLEKEQDEKVFVQVTFGPYHYGSHYSNSGIVLHFLVRLPPYTNMFVHYQDNNFDLPDRTFHSMNTSWRLASADSTTDVKELIPEFFFLPEMFMNSEGFNLGVRQNGQQVNNVELPPWCRKDGRLFTLIHRQALETHYVTENLQNWIDLVFGYKQTGKAAVEAINVFHPATYYGFDLNPTDDPLRLEALKTMIKTFGQTPMQLFRRPHPLVSLSLTPRPQSSCVKQVMEEVHGLKWGNYVGSPSEPEPVENLRKLNSKIIGSFVSLDTNEVFGLAPKTALLAQYCKVKGVSAINTTYVKNAALLHWGSHDGLIRIQLRRENQLQVFAAMDMADKVTCCATAPDCRFIFFGKSSGNIVVYHYLFDSEPANTGSSVTVKWKKITHLYGHDTEVSAIHICKEFRIAVSASADATCIIWDLNHKLRYIRTINDHENVVTLVRVSETSGDIASVSNLHDGGSVLMLHTINAAYIAKVKCKNIISSICFSCAPEGISVNVICAGFQNGTIV
ncbi:hypothetical protein CHUAL_007205 [Chamberlinius hualienensis]